MSFHENPAPAGLIGASFWGAPSLFMPSASFWFLINLRTLEILTVAHIYRSPKVGANPKQTLHSTKLRMRTS